MLKKLHVRSGLEKVLGFIGKHDDNIISSIVLLTSSYAILLGMHGCNSSYREEYQTQRALRYRYIQGALRQGYKFDELNYKRPEVVALNPINGGLYILYLRDDGIVQSKSMPNLAPRD